MDITDSSAPIDVIRVNGLAFVSGLYWQTMRKAVTYENEAKDFGRENNMDVVTIRKTRLVIQAGFAPKGKGALKGMYSLAASLAQVLGDNWLGAFPVDTDAGTYAFVAVLDGGVMPGRDLVGTREVIEEKLRETFGLVAGSNGAKKFERTIAPAEWDFGGEELALEDLLHKRVIKATAKLKPLTFGMTRREIITYAGAAVAIAALLIGGLTVKHYWEAKKEAEQLAAAQAMLAAQQAAARTHVAPAPVVPPHPWGVSSPAIDMARSCDAGLGFALSIAGWMFSKATCSDAGITATYTRNGTAPLDVFRAEARRLMASDSKVFDNGESATVLGVYQPPAAADEGLRHDFDATVAFASHFQALDIKAPLAEAPDAPAAPVPAGSPPPPPLPWKTYTFKFDTKLPPSLVMAGMELSGLRIHQIDVALKDGNSPELTWTISGDLYVLR